MGALPQAAVVIVAPSPPAGEGCEAFPQMMMGEGAEPLDLNPSPNRMCWTFGAVLSRKGRGHSNVRRARGCSAAGIASVSAT
jgi:hypothetical protein